ncbi:MULTISPECIES: sigma 54-interacting transcriptional regulator [unclassified Corallococcus]|uniref:sigma 54-interacting transcriptional regulator n=1 Tax=unclassified Corallococcus TaxID=2685029 RepID=UPI001A8F7189|nr:MULTISPECIES: sigma 54-interacting transcriptional regulator [unclassified Corallococcus]MBN9685705.1 sigma 54-interacting transcriptional regulator [Corallococcus sp. NCSPR001]WAS82850.1 sigma 54-interacting transcriptional regulator [Corallococcus sp. NCRR]
MRFFLSLPDGRSISLEKPVVSVGSEPACDVVLSAPGVKGSHALVFRDARGWTVSAASADCDVRVRGRRVELAPLEPGESFSVGKASLTLTVSEAPVRASPSPAPSRLVGVLTDFASRLLVQRPASELLEAALRGIAEVTSADVGFLVSVEGERRRVLGATGSVPASVVVDSLVDQVVGSGAPVLVPDVAAEAALAGAPSVLALRLTSALVLPLRAGAAPLCVVYLGRRLGSPPFATRELEEAMALSSLAALLLATSRELTELRAQVDSLTQRIAAATFEGLIGESPAMRNLYRQVERLGPTSLHVLIQGETGTGKEEVARALHRRSGRRGRLVAINCAALPESLIERELFGHVRGAFSGAASDRAGLVEAADGGTLFLDEIGDMPLPLQSRLLRVVQEHEVTRLGEHRPRRVDMRVVAATHQPLKALVARGAFREDLLFRLDEVRLEVPALRERGDDVLLIAHHVLKQEAGRARGFTQKAAEALRGHPFPGNVRELVSRVRRAAILASGELIGVEDLDLAADTAPLVPLDEARDAFVLRYVREAIARSGGSKKEAARALGIGVRSVFRYLGEED